MERVTQKEWQRKPPCKAESLQEAFRSSYCVQSTVGIEQDTNRKQLRGSSFRLRPG